MSEHENTHSSKGCLSASELQLEARVTELEIHLAHRDAALDALSNEVAHANKKMAELETLIKILIRKTQPQDSGSEIEPFNASLERPPHY